MSLVRLALVLPQGPSASEPIRAAGAVVRCEHIPDERPPAFEVAVYFTEIAEADRQRIVRFVNGQLSETR